MMRIGLLGTLLILLGVVAHENTVSATEPKEKKGSKPVQQGVVMIRVGGDISLRPILGMLGSIFADAAEYDGKVVEVELDLAPGLLLFERASSKASDTDVWIFMNPEPLQQLAQKNIVIADSARTLATDGLAVVTAWPVVKKGSPPPWQILAEKRWKLVAVANYRNSPSGFAGVKVLKANGLWEKLDYRVEFRPDSDEVLSDVLRARVDAGMIYRSESRRLTQKKSHTIYELTGQDAEFVICAAVDAGTKKRKIAEKLVGFMSQKAEIWKSYGYELPNVRR